MTSNQHGPYIRGDTRAVSYTHLIYVIPDTVTAHWLYLLAVVVVVALLYVVFMKKYYCLHEEYLSLIHI